MHELPEGLDLLRRSPEFDEATLPGGLQREHRTKAGTWALIHIVQGELKYRILEPATEVVLKPGRSVVVQPEQPHEVEVIGPVRMFIEFFKKENE